MQHPTPFVLVGLLCTSGAAWAQEAGAEPAEEAEAPEAEAEAPPAAPTGPAMLAAPPPPPPPPEDDLPIPTLTIDRIPPNISYEVGVQVGYGTLTYWPTVDGWPAFGVRGAYGKNFGLHRIGGDLTVTAEGPIGVHTTIAAEPHLDWDYIDENGFHVGAGLGPALLYHASSATPEGATAFGVAPSFALRIGGSQTWSRVGRRLFVFLEPKVRYLEDANGRWALNPVAAIVVGSGRGG